MSSHHLLCNICLNKWLFFDKQERIAQVFCLANNRARSGPVFIGQNIASKPVFFWTSPDSSVLYGLPNTPLVKIRAVINLIPERLISAYRMSGSITVTECEAQLSKYHHPY
ncbi:uncharacterized protein LOC109825659 [Asparagus officinalis]|uniref:uncharacterized protein LOC109825659 n=1 Tax=Asparagus officinalis TaxID=4686 RepID=UPI00098E100C|nr:uncharacterized protein LOC109825659 [Asparagus officinalis]